MGFWKVLLLRIPLDIGIEAWIQPVVISAAIRRTSSWLSPVSCATFSGGKLSLIMLRAISALPSARPSFRPAALPSCKPMVLPSSRNSYFISILIDLMILSYSLIISLSLPFSLSMASLSTGTFIFPGSLSCRSLKSLLMSDSIVSR